MQPSASRSPSPNRTSRRQSNQGETLPLLKRSSIPLAPVAGFDSERVDNVTGHASPFAAFVNQQQRPGEASNDEQAAKNNDGMMYHGVLISKKGESSTSGSAFHQAITGKAGRVVVGRRDARD